MKRLGLVVVLAIGGVCCRHRTVVHFTCDNGLTIDATFYPGDDKVVDLVLPHDRRVSLPHAMSGSGARYANQDESLVFWNKGNTAFVEERGKTTIDGCVAK